MPGWISIPDSSSTHLTYWKPFNSFLENSESDLSVLLKSFYRDDLQALSNQAWKWEYLLSARGHFLSAHLEAAYFSFVASVLKAPVEKGVGVRGVCMCVRCASKYLNHWNISQHAAAHQQLNRLAQTVPFLLFWFSLMPFMFLSHENSFGCP